MGRRSTHTPEQLRELILDAAQAIIESNGLAGLSAREIARRIGYSPGTIYNMFQNLDDVVLHVEARVLDALDARLAAALTQGPPEEGARRLAEAYLAFTHERPKLWNLLFEHYMPGGSDTPPWYQQKLELLMTRSRGFACPTLPCRRRGRAQARCACALGRRTRHHVAVNGQQTVQHYDRSGRPVRRRPGQELSGWPRCQHGHA